MPDAAGAERDAAVVERRHRDLEAGAELAEPVASSRDADAVEEELGRVLRAQAELALDRARLEAVRVGRDDEARDAARPGLAGAREDERVRGPRAERDEDLLAADHPVVAVALGARLEPARVGAGARLGQRVAAERLAGGERRAGGAPSARRCPTWRRTCRRGRSRRRRCRARSSRRGRAPRRRARTRPCRAPCRRAPRAAPRRGSRARRACRRSTRSIVSVRSHSAACGAISASQKSRAVSRISCCSSESVKSTRTILPSGGAADVAHRHADRPPVACAFDSHSAGFDGALAPCSRGTLFACACLLP